MANNLSLGGPAGADPFKAPMKAYQMWKRVAKKALKAKDEEAYHEAQYWMREHELEIEALGGILLAAARPPGRLTPVVKARMEAAKKALAERAKDRKALDS